MLSATTRFFSPARAPSRIPPRFSCSRAMSTLTPASTPGAKPPLVAVIGTTGVGKTDLSVELAKAVGARERAPKRAEVLNHDSMQCYRGLDVITNKATDEEMQGVPHHLMGFLEPGEEWSVNDFLAGALDKVRTSTTLPYSGRCFELVHTDPRVPATRRTAHRGRRHDLLPAEPRLSKPARRRRARPSRLTLRPISSNCTRRCSAYSCRHVALPALSAQDDHFPPTRAPRALSRAPLAPANLVALVLPALVPARPPPTAAPRARDARARAVRAAAGRRSAERAEVALARCAQGQAGTRRRVGG